MTIILWNKGISFLSAYRKSGIKVQEDIQYVIVIWNSINYYSFVRSNL